MNELYGRGNETLKTTGWNKLTTKTELGKKRFKIRDERRSIRNGITDLHGIIIEYYEQLPINW